MTNNELNQFILHYLVEDKTHSAIMLTGAWGTGKSYYIQNELVPFLKEEHEKECVTVSLYGIKSTAEISRSIYIELRAKTLSAKGEAAVAGKLIAKTIVRGVVSRFGIDFSKENDTMQELYESINLSNKLVILEDIERSQIEVIELLGYVNSLVEQDNVKVLLVANENEMLKYNGDAKELPLFERKRTIITRAEQSYGRVPFAGLCRNFVHFRICSRCRTAGCQGISFSSSSWVGDLPR